jgi:hypothetical protein
MNMLARLDEASERVDLLCERLDALNTSLLEFPRDDQQHSPAQREWERFVLSDGGVCANGTLTVGGGGSNLRPAATGWEAYITSIAVTVSGASAAATVANYNGEVADLNLFDYANALLGNTPSRIVAFYDRETVYVEQGDAITIVVAGAVSTANVTIRVAGKRRML